MSFITGRASGLVVLRMKCQLIYTFKVRLGAAHLYRAVRDIKSTLPKRGHASGSEAGIWRTEYSIGVLCSNSRIRKAAPRADSRWTHDRTVFVRFSLKPTSMTKDNPIEEGELVDGKQTEKATRTVAMERIVKSRTKTNQVFVQDDSRMVSGIDQVGRCLCETQRAAI